MQSLFFWLSVCRSMQLDRASGEIRWHKREGPEIMSVPMPRLAISDIMQGFGLPPTLEQSLYCLHRV